MNDTTTLKRRPAKAPSAYEGLGDVLAGGFDHLLTSEDHMSKVALADIEIGPQIREEMEDDEQRLDDLGRNLRKRQAQNIIVRPNPAGSAKSYRLVAGERRVRAALAEGLTHLWALVATLTDEEAADLQAAENIQRKNLTLKEQARAVQRDLERLGGVDAVLAKHHKSRAWLSKMTGLLSLPAQASRIVDEHVSADLEVIHAVKLIEGVDPKKAKALVDRLKKTRGGASARAQVAKVKAEVKPRRAAGPAPAPAVPRSALMLKGKGETPGSEREALSRAYIDIFEGGKRPSVVLAGLTKDARHAVEAFLAPFHAAGAKATDIPRAVIEGLRSGRFDVDDAGAFALVAYLDGAAGQHALDLQRIFDCLKT